MGTYQDNEHRTELVVLPGPVLRVRYPYGRPDVIAVRVAPEDVLALLADIQAAADH